MRTTLVSVECTCPRWSMMKNTRHVLTLSCRPCPVLTFIRTSLACVPLQAYQRRSGVVVRHARGKPCRRAPARRRTSRRYLEGLCTEVQGEVANQAGATRVSTHATRRSGRFCVPVQAWERGIVAPGGLHPPERTPRANEKYYPAVCRKVISFVSPPRRYPLCCHVSVISSCYIILVTVLLIAPASNHASQIFSLHPKLKLQTTLCI